MHHGNGGYIQVELSNMDGLVHGGISDVTLSEARLIGRFGGSRYRCSAAVMKMACTGVGAHLLLGGGVGVFVCGSAAVRPRQPGQAPASPPPDCGPSLWRAGSPRSVSRSAGSAVVSAHPSPGVAERCVVQHCLRICPSISVARSTSACGSPIP